jgi:hypothetical protein
MSVFPQTRAAAAWIGQHGPGDLTRARARALLKRLRACEAALASADPGLPAVTQGLLRGLVLTVRDLAGPGWLAARTGTPDIDAFTALDSAPRSPAPAVLDEILSRVLRARFTGQQQPPGS